MRQIGILASMAAGILLAGCVAQGPDQAPPVIAFFEGGASSPFFVSDGSVRARGCESGLAESYAAFSGGAANTHVRSGGGTARLRITFSDPSGIKRAYVQIPGGTLVSPQTNSRVQIPTASGDITDAFEYNFYGDDAAPVKSHTVIVEVTHGDANRVFNAFAIDMNDNRSATSSLLIGERTRICG
jgi:hypothetical protein